MVSVLCIIDQAMVIEEHQCALFNGVSLIHACTEQSSYHLRLGKLGWFIISLVLNKVYTQLMIRDLRHDRTL